MRIAFIGIGNVGFALANNLQKKGHDIIIAHDDLQSDSVVQAMTKNTSFSAQAIQEAVDQAQIIFLATPFGLNEEILKPLNFHGKTLVDCTNPVGPGISHGLESKISGAEKVQEWSRNAHVVKAFTIYGYENLENPEFPDYNVRPVMLMAGDYQESKEITGKLINELGFDAFDAGGLSQSLHLEHMTLLWVKMVRVNGHSPEFTWACLQNPGF